MRRSRLKIFSLYFAPQFSVYTKFGIDPEQHCQQILPDVPNPRCVLFQAVHDETDMLAVQLQQLRPHNLGRIIISADTDTVTGATNRFLYQLGDLVKLLPVNARIACQNVVIKCSPESIPDSCRTIPSFPFASARESPGNRKGKESNR